MQQDIFREMKVPQGARAHVINPPGDYPYDPDGFQFHSQGDNFDFVQVFVDNPAQLAEKLAEGEKMTRDGGLLWASLPTEALEKAELEKRGAPLGLKPGQQLKLDDNWTAVQIERT